MEWLLQLFANPGVLFLFSIGSVVLLMWAAALLFKKVDRLPPPVKDKKKDPSVGGKGLR